MAALNVFLDANLLFSAAQGGRAFDLLWDLAAAGKVALHSSRPCFVEARENLLRNKPTAVSVYDRLCARITEVTEDDADLNWASNLGHEKDAPVLAAAALGMEVLLTGDVQDLGTFMGRSDLGLRVCTLRDFLLRA